ncbi:hypothetical protein JW899_04780 [Candidatus Uhrbacteria bacterium]|nr:hypothetical protein [Candidatus Uhrbacteria bacterium]
MNKTEELFREGATEKDIEWWKSLGSHGQEMILSQDKSFRLAGLLRLKSLGMSPEGAFRRVIEEFVNYGEYPLTEGMKNEYDSLGLSADDYPLPYEVHKRIDRFMRWALIPWKRRKVKSERSGYRTMNGYIRSKLKKGEI